MIANWAIVKGLGSGNEEQQALGCYCLHSLGQRRLAINLDWWMQRVRRRFAIHCIWCPFDLGFFSDSGRYPLLLPERFVKKLAVSYGRVSNADERVSPWKLQLPLGSGRAHLCHPDFLSAIPTFFLVSFCLVWIMGESW